MNKDLITKLNYEKLAIKAMDECAKSALNFNKWPKYYGLYCSGRELNIQAEREIRVNARGLAEVLRKAQISKRTTKHEQELVETARKEIIADLELSNDGPELGLTPKK